MNQQNNDRLTDMDIDEETLDAVGGVIPQDSLRSFVSLKESDCYALVDDGANNKTYIKEPAYIVYESIRWGSRMLKGHPLYWADKRKLLTRILRSANTALFTQGKEYDGYNAVDAMVGFRGNVQLWLAVVGNVNVWNYGNTHIGHIYPNEGEICEHALGYRRYGFAPSIVSVPFQRQGFTLVSTGGVTEHLQNISATVFDTFEDVVGTFLTIKKAGAWIAIPHTVK